MRPRKGVDTFRLIFIHLTFNEYLVIDMRKYWKLQYILWKSQEWQVFVCEHIFFCKFRIEDWSMVARMRAFILANGTDLLSVTQSNVLKANFDHLGSDCMFSSLNSANNKTTQNSHEGLYQLYRTWWINWSLFSNCAFWRHIQKRTSLWAVAFLVERCRRSGKILSLISRNCKTTLLIWILHYFHFCLWI